MQSRTTLPDATMTDRETDGGKQVWEGGKAVTLLQSSLRKLIH